MINRTFEDRNSIILENLGHLEFRSDIPASCTTEINHINAKDDEYKEIHPSLTLSEEQAVKRSLQYNILRKIEVKPKSFIRNATRHFDTWSSINTIISTDYGKDSCIYFKLSRWITIHASMITMACIFFLVIPMMVMSDNNNSDVDYIATLLSTNELWLANTPIFYGFYNQTQSGTSIYSISRAYFWVNMLTRLVFVLIIIRKFIFSVSIVYTERYHSTVLESAIGSRFILGMWDFRSITKRNTEFCRVNIKDFIRKLYSSSTLSKKATTSLNVLINIISLGLIAAVLERISWLITEDESFFQSNLSKYISTWAYVRSPIVVSLAIITVTWIFDLVKCIEDYGKEYIKILASTGRIILLNCGTSIILIYHWSTMISCTNDPSIVSNRTVCTLLRDKIVISSNSLLFTCWETWFGQRILVYILVNILISFIFYIVVDVIKSILNYSQTLIKPKFFYTAFIANICYMDCLFWCGYYYSPLLPVLSLLMIVLLFFYNINVISVSCFPRASSSQTVTFQRAIFIFMLVISSLIGISTLASHSLLFRPSRRCGPFAHLDYNYSPEDFQSLTSSIGNNFIKKVVDIGDQLLVSDGLWYSSIIVLLSLAFKFTFQVKALRQIYVLALGDKRMIEKDNRRASENCLGFMERLQKKRSKYEPLVNPKEANDLDIEYEKFII